MSAAPVFMIASENGALPGGKAGGVGDVIRELPRALVAKRPVTVITPAYGRLHRVTGMRHEGTLAVSFAGGVCSVDHYAMTDAHGVCHRVLAHALFDPTGSGQIYHDDGGERPFATDAGKFALLSAAAATWLAEQAPDECIVHLHDWHAAPVLVLRALDAAYSRLRRWRTVLTLHNLALQGIRPLANDPSSLAQWFPLLDRQQPDLIDPRYPDCFNPIAAGIRLADSINTVSPTNAEEILTPNDASRAFRGGEGLEGLLRQANAEGRLHGILNGCDYAGDYSRLDWPALLATIDKTLADWHHKDGANAAIHELAATTLATWARTPPKMLLTSVGRLTEQKISLLLARDHEGVSTLQRLLVQLPEDCLFVLLGSGDRDYETSLVEHARDLPRFVFLRGFSEALSDVLYRAGHLFVMPSSFEPCGISQMMAMRAGQPCLVHAVGGLNDTVEDNVSGYRFSGHSLGDLIHQFLKRAAEAVGDFYNDHSRWQQISHTAAAQRFTWDAAAAQYNTVMYRQ